MTPNLIDLLGEYWDTAYEEGRLFSSQGNRANDALHAIREHVKALELDAKRYRWLRDHATERMTDKSSPHETALEHKTEYVFPKLIAWADFCGPIPMDMAIDAAITAREGKL